MAVYILTLQMLAYSFLLSSELQATEVFQQRPAQRCDRAALCSELADRYSVTTTAIRHIWDRRTWVWTNLPHWTPAELAASLAEGTCDECKLRKVDKVEDTCEACPINRKRAVQPELHRMSSTAGDPAPP